MAANSNLIRSFFVRYLIGTTLSVLVIGLFWLLSSYHYLQAERRILEDQAVQQQMAQLKSRVGNVIELIQIERRLNAERINQRIKSRVYNAHALMTNIYRQYRDQLDREQIEEMIRHALRSISYNNGRGYFFITALDGTEQLYPPSPGLEGSNFLEIVDIKGKVVVSDMIAIIREKGEGFYHYNWSNPDSNDTPQAKTAFIKHFEPFDWLVGTGDRIDDVTRDLQRDLINRIEKITFENGSYVFVTSYEGIGLSYPATGKNMYGVTDVNGVKIVQELIRLAKEGGGYLNYVMPPLKGQRPEPKISYVEGIDDWQWYIGSGDFVADLDNEVEIMLAERQADMKVKIATVFCVILFFLIAGYCSSRKLGRQIHSSIRQFQDFFDQAARQGRQIDSDRQDFLEFQQLATSANLMLKERMRYEQEANEYRQQLSSVIDSMPSILLTIDGHGEISQWNRFAIQETGISESQALGHPVGSVLPYLNNLMDDILSVSGHEQKLFQARVELVKNGSHSVKNISSYPISGSDPQRIVIRIDDITDRVRMEEMMVQTEKMMSVGGLAAGMAHEINNPLSIISQAAQNTKRRISPEHPANSKTAAEVGLDLDKMDEYLDKRGIHGFLKNICNGVERSAEIIQNMLNFSSNNSSKRECCSLESIINDSINLVRNDYDLKRKSNFRNVLIDTDLPQDLPKIAVNRIEIQQVIFNLLKNAGQAMFDIDKENYQPRIEVAATADEKSLTLTVRDNGPGIDEEIQSRIFEPFFTTKEVGVGTGLGLSVSYFIVVNRHQGSFRISSEPGQGTLFTIVLPRKTQC